MRAVRWPFLSPEYRIVWTTMIHRHIAKEDPMGHRDMTRGNSTPTLGYASGPLPRRVLFSELVYASAGSD